MSILKRYLNILPLVILLSSCVKENFNNIKEEAIIPVEELGITKLVIPEDFNFATVQKVQISITDNESQAKYDVYAYNDVLVDVGVTTYTDEEGNEITTSDYRPDVLNNLLFSGSPSNGKLNHTISIPTYYDQLYIRRKHMGVYSSEVINITDEHVFFTYTQNSSKNTKTSKNSVEDFLYCVNGSAELFQVNPLDGAYTAISTMPMGSYTCAIDQVNRNLYSIGKSSPHPLMKYSIDLDTWTTVADIGKGGPRLDYNTIDGLLYFSTQDKLYSYDPLNGNLISSWNIYGLDSTSGGDLAFSDTGALYMCTFSGLYLLTIDGNGDYQADRISADNLPFSPTSMTFDSNNELWLASNGSSSDLIIMDTVTGGWQYNYGPSANNNSDLGRTINDLTTFRIISEEEDNTDTDGDGIIDKDDTFPDDADKAFESYTPSKYGYGTLAFEDLWPYIGDYDFNDAAINYKIIGVENSANNVVEVNFEITVKSHGASYVNALAIEFENLIPSQVASVTGNVLTQNYINLNENGTEANQDNAVVILYDDNFAMLNQPITVTVTFTTPLSTAELGTAPFNPFIIINKEREKEVHLPYGHTTSLGSKNTTADLTNKDTDGNYVSEQGLPWAINIIHDFKVPTEKTAVNEAYNHFNTWATSGGTLFEDWYKDSDGYRNSNKIVQ